MIREAAISLKIIKKTNHGMNPITPKTMLFDENGNLKFLDLGINDVGSSNLANLFYSNHEYKVKYKLLFFTSLIYLNLLLFFLEIRIIRKNAKKFDYR